MRRDYPANDYRANVLHPDVHAEVTISRRTNNSNDRYRAPATATGSFSRAVSADGGPFIELWIAAN